MKKLICVAVAVAVVIAGISTAVILVCKNRQECDEDDMIDFDDCEFAQEDKN